MLTTDSQAFRESGKSTAGKQITGSGNGIHSVLKLVPRIARTYARPERREPIIKRQARRPPLKQMNAYTVINCLGSFCFFQLALWDQSLIVCIRLL